MISAPIHSASRAANSSATARWTKNRLAAVHASPMLRGPLEALGEPAEDEKGRRRQHEHRAVAHPAGDDADVGADGVADVVVARPAEVEALGELGNHPARGTIRHHRIGDLVRIGHADPDEPLRLLLSQNPGAIEICHQERSD
ncbi:hypothetical protein [Micromonospora sp. KC207]|uniref:hypothetical protein n=1 Tax=Micromonospora sp. KC207 TaxID=2530377 RepID=UPI001FB77F0A|nr:hypothetical protein [Micromonospora sp. KC207]